MKWMEKWSELRDYPTEQAERFLTVYLNIEPAGGRQTEAELKLKQGLKRLVEFAEASESKEQVSYK